MRIIEERMIRAIKDNRDWREDNTRVVNTGLGTLEVYLFDNLIARRLNARNEWELTLAGWNTVTTRSRINAILSAFFPDHAVGTRKGEPYLAWNNFTGSRALSEYERFTLSAD